MDISTALSTIQTALGIVKTVREIDNDYDAAALRAQMAELYNNLADVKMALADARTDLHDKDRVIRELQERIEALTSGEGCPICGTGRMKVTSSRPHPSFAFAGVQERTVKCDNPDCGHSESRLHDPGEIVNSKS